MSDGQIGSGHVLALSGGVGGAKLACGLSRILQPSDLTIVANTGDDFEHLGLHISPDIDTLVYTLAGVQSESTGWGRRDETWSFMAALCELGGERWFKLGDRDLAVHVERTRRLQAGESLSAITERISRCLGVPYRVIPMTDDRVRTRVMTPNGVLDFQRYFVEAQCEPNVTGLIFEGAEQARLHPEIFATLENPNLRAIIVCPSNPFISIDPMLALPRFRTALADSAAPVIAVSPIIGGKAVKGPTAKMMSGFGLAVNPRTVAAHYKGIIDGFVIDTVDEAMASEIDLPVKVMPILMLDQQDRENLARAVLDFANHLAQHARSAQGACGR